MDEKKFWIGLAVALFAWFGYGYFALRDWISQNAIIAFFIVIGIFLFIAMRYVLGVDPLKNPQKFLAFFLIWLVFDIISFPLLVTPQGLVTQDPYGNISSDVIVYRMLNQTGDLGYYLTFVGAPLLLLYMARKLVSGKTFFSYVRESV